MSVIGRDCAWVFGDADRLEAMIAGRVSTKKVERADATLAEGQVGLVHVASWSDEVVQTHLPNEVSGGVQLEILERAADTVMAGQARALVTAPVSKEAIAMSGAEFCGHTEFLAERAGLARDVVTMMFLGPKLRIALATTHLPIAKVSEAITERRVRRAITHLAEAMIALGYGDRDIDGDSVGTIEVTGLNPHAGEGGLLGHEDAGVIEPVIRGLRKQPPFSNGRLTLGGPSPAEAVLRYAAAGQVDGVVAMYHDQATIASKILDWGQAVNVTWGLPYVRTSVDHGVAYDAASQGLAEDQGMRAAIELAQRLTG